LSDNIYFQKVLNVVGERERKQAPILGGGDLRSKYNRLGLVGVTRNTLTRQGAGIINACPSGSRRVPSETF